ncbi:phage head morphogenesis protein [Glaesserella parasuis]|nr:phage head morphogenesis protein [Glaesserella parasuis]MCT8838227.1 phage head morphogenesis protein [Glaesserella parasuis]MCT8839957.1 phage head morphogenesis protein [Glaesserella parasuis]MDE3995301.1 phage head morphogenesis protein [Glaesserella parasuis]MDE4013050.1 phage head morphogenesis protein [Glaesserella parasuis]
MSIVAQPLPFSEQIEYFRKKVNIPTATYLDIYGEAHDYAFVVAGAHTQEIIGDFRRAIDDVIERGGTLEEFRKVFDAIADKHSWEYNGGRNWRSRIIYDTNLYASYNHGRYMQQRELADVMPYWEYEHNDSAHPRPQHVAWDGLVLRADDPWWDYHYPTRAYGCHCTVRALDDVDLKYQNKTVQQAPEIEWEEKVIGQRSGSPRIVRVPKGVDPSFEHPKRLVPVHKVDEILMQKLVEAPPQFASSAVSNVLNYAPALALLNRSMKEMVDTVVADKMARGQMKYVGVIPRDVVKKLETMELAPQTAVIAVRDDDILHALRDVKQGKGINLPLEFWQQLPEKLRSPTAILFEQSQKQPTLLFIYKTEQGKVAVKMDYEVKVKNQVTQQKERVKLNMVRTASRIEETKEWGNLKHSYELLWGSLD